MCKNVSHLLLSSRQELISPGATHDKEACRHPVSIAIQALFRANSSIRLSSQQLLHLKLYTYMYIHVHMNTDV